jgi:hypothetical protein
MARKGTLRSYAAPMNWEELAAMSTVIGAAIVVVTAVYAARQVHEAKVARRTELLLTLHGRYHSDDLQRFRRRLLMGELGDLAALSDDDTDELMQLLNELQFYALLMQMNLLKREDVASVLGGSPSRVWNQVAGFVHALRAERHDATYHRELEAAFASKNG